MISTRRGYVQAASRAPDHSTSSSGSRWLPGDCLDLFAVAVC